MIAAIDYAVYATVGELIGDVGTAIAQNATVHVQLDVWSNIFWLKSPTLKFIARSFLAVLVTEIL